MVRKVILSRKGFDSSSGGKPSPILGDRLMSLPIPLAGSNDFYRNLTFSETESYLKIMQDLGIKGHLEGHVDPDIRRSIIVHRPSEWRGTFGQSGTSQANLRNQNVGKGDIFLFFGWFKEAWRVNGSWVYRQNAPNIHMIYGYLEVEEVYDLNSIHTIPSWVKYHPHYRDRADYDQKRNAIYTATGKFSTYKDKAGWGVFDYDESLVLTKKGSKKRSLWELPACFKSERGSFKCGFSLWNETNKGTLEVQQRGMGDQELFISGNPEIVKWAENLIASCSSEE
ncbi:hypothetical protein [Mesobacillus jeotgali]|uniref:Nucleotide modification associated domain-containing protein n=1 Tax=Mesobacillus jeotgali TaxID=129985 RepID=A0ABY9VGD9_9BACI|nr:hypothetical protein [Mesobacillus jeotgali]WNF22658.1 hypothetical protein RH061_21290 [Mesobacillus jeotgali]